MNDKSFIRILVAVIIVVVIGVVGFFAFLNKSKTPNNNPNNQNQTSTTSAENTTAITTKVTTANKPGEWETYKSDQYGFSIKHPRDWSVGIGQAGNSAFYLPGDELHSVAIWNKNFYDYDITISILPNSKDLNIKDYINDQISKSDTGYAECVKEKEDLCGSLRRVGWNTNHPVFFDKTDAYEFTVSDHISGTYMYILTKKNGNIYALTYGTIPDLEDTPIKEIKSIISTFKFL